MSTPTPTQSYSADQIVANELTRIQQKKQGIEDAYNTQLRLLGFNNSFNSRYSYYLRMLYVFIGALVIFGLLSFIGNMFPIPSIIIDVLVIILACGTIAILSSYYYDMSRRSNMDFNELALAPPSDMSGSIVVGGTTLVSDVQGNLSIFGQCIGSDCCGVDTSWNPITYSCEYVNDFNNSSTSTTPTPVTVTHSSMAINQPIINGFTTMTPSVGGVIPNSAYEFSEYSKI
uniref:Uncharacterized protein n=1 Tax=viral metagenome TaxID=1070528 RepID=A0A6C0DR73_9ZZZZ